MLSNNDGVTLAKDSILEQRNLAQRKGVIETIGSVVRNVPAPFGAGHL